MTLYVTNITSCNNRLLNKMRFLYSHIDYLFSYNDYISDIVSQEKL